MKPIRYDSLSALRRTAADLQVKYPQLVFFIAPADWECETFARARDEGLDPAAPGTTLPDAVLEECGPLDIYYAERNQLDWIYTPVSRYAVRPLGDE